MGRPVIPSAIVRAVALLFAASLAAEGQSTVQRADIRRWRRRVIPLPKEMAVAGRVTTRAGALHLGPCDSEAPQARTAVRLLKSLALADKAKASVILRMTLTRAASRGVAKRLTGLPNADQAYAILSAPGAGKAPARIDMVANTPTGLLYAARTLAMLLDPGAKVTPDTPIEAPLVNVVDWPDIEERGSWGCGNTRCMPWASRWKLNLVEVYAHAWIDPKTGRTRLGLGGDYLPRGHALGVKVIPYLPHIPGPVIRALAELRRLAKGPNMPERYRPLLTGFCYSKPAALDLLTEWMILQAEMVRGYHHDLEVWLSESRQDQKRAFLPSSAGRDSYLLEVRAILTAFERVKRKHPKARLRLWQSQGTHKENARLLALLPREIGVAYYDSGRTYTNARKPMIYPALEEAARSGRFVGVVPEFTPSHRTVAPYTAPQFVHYRVREFADKKLRSVSGYFVPDLRYYDFNVMAVAEWTWNARGRSPREFAAAYATVTGFRDPELFAAWAMRAGQAGWALARSRFFYNLVRDPAMGFYGALPFDHRYEFAQFLAVDNMKENLAAAEEALRLARQRGDRRMTAESEFALNGLRAFGLLDSISKILRAPSCDATARKALGDLMDRLDRAAHAVRLSHLDWREIVAGGKRVHSRCQDTTMALLHCADIIRTVAAPLRVPDRYAALRPVELGEWSHRDVAGKTATLAFDVTPWVPPEGGEFHVVFDSLSGIQTWIRSIDLVRADGGRPLAKSPDAGGLAHVGRYAPFAELRLSAPATPPGTRLSLRVALTVRSKDCAGIVSLRRVWERGGSEKALKSARTSRRLATPRAVARASAGTPEVGKRGAIRVGVTPGIGSRRLLAVLGNTKGMTAESVERLRADVLGRYDVLIVTQAPTPLRLIRAAPTVIAWVEKGGGVLFLHDAVGYRRHMAMFKDIGGGVHHPKLDKLRVVAEHPVTQGLGVGCVFSPGYRYDHVVLQRGARGRTLVENSLKAPVVIAGKVGKGRVLLNGMATGVSSEKGESAIQDRGPAGDELRILLNGVQWLAGRSSEAPTAPPARKPKVPRTYREAVTSGRAKYDADWHDAARKDYEAARGLARASADKAHAQLFVAHCRFRAREWEAAERAYAAASEIEGARPADRVDALLGVGKSLQARGKYERAAAAFAAVSWFRAVPPRGALTARQKTGECLYLRKRYREALRVYDEVSCSAHATPWLRACARLAAARCYREMSETERALRAYAEVEAATKAHPRLAASAALERGRLLMAGGRHAQARAAFRDVLKIEKADARTRGSARHLLRALP